MRQVRLLTLFYLFSCVTSLSAEEARRAELVSPPKKSAPEEPKRALPVAATDKKDVAATAKKDAPSIEIDLGASEQSSKKIAKAPAKKEIVVVATKPTKEPVVSAKKEVVVTAKKETHVAVKEPAPVEKKAPETKKEFTFKDEKGKTISAEVVDQYQSKRIVYPLGKTDQRVNAKLVRAASIAQERARAHSKSACWHYVKNALLASGVITSYPKSALAKQAGEELVRDYGFKKLPIHDPYQAPIGAVLVYGGKGAGHVEIRNKTGFVSDFRAPKPSKRKLIGVYAKA